MPDLEKVILNPERVMLNLFQHLFRAGLFQGLVVSMHHETLNQVQGDKSGGFYGYA
jgi:hypothetical protein